MRWFRSIATVSRLSNLSPLSRLADLWLQSACPLCQRSTPQPFCPDCERQLQRLRLPSDRQVWQPPLPLFAWGQYGGSLKRAIAALKYELQPQLARPLGDWLGQAWLEYHRATPHSTPHSMLQAGSSQPSVRSQLQSQPNSKSNPKPRSIVVVPIPLHAEKQQQRGFNQAELLAASFCQRTGLPLYAQGLSRDRDTVAQFGLTASDRATNLAGAFSVNPALRQRFPGAAVLLLDDIYTTGATAKTAAAILRRQQISVYGVVALAKTAASD